MGRTTGENAGCDKQHFPCGCLEGLCRGYDPAGLCPTSCNGSLPTAPSVVFAACTTSTKALKRQQLFGQPFFGSQYDILYLSDEAVANSEVQAWPSRFSNIHLQTSSDCPATLGRWANPGERCAWSQIMDTFNRFPAADWYAMGDDDTLWVPQNLQQALSTFPPSSMAFLGGLGSHKELNIAQSFNRGNSTFPGTLAWGGAGMVLSRAAMQQLQSGFLACISDVRDLFGGDERISHCVERLCNTSLHALPGFHQLDYFDPTDLFHQHPISPVFSLHHVHEPSVSAAMMASWVHTGTASQWYCCRSFPLSTGPAMPEWARFVSCGSWV